MDLLRLALALIGPAVAPPPRRSLAGTASAMVAAAFAALAIVAASGCAAAALWIGMAPLVGPIGAPLVVAAVLVALALVALGLAWRAVQPRPTAAPVPASVGASSEALLAEAARLVVAHKGPALFAALLAGVIAGAREK